MTDDEKRVRERGDASDLVGTVEVRRADGTLVPYLDDEGDEVLGVATGPPTAPSGDDQLEGP